ncbi:MAG TPA: response regulator, partial [Anaerolineaceae bacterium]
LHVEDNFDNRVLVRRLLQSCGYQVIEAGNAAKAREILKTSRPDLILMDINMPDVDGYTLTSEIKAMPDHASVPIVAITANVMKGDRERTLSAGCDGYIEKPIDVDRFLEQVEHFIG